MSVSFVRRAYTSGLLRPVYRHGGRVRISQEAVSDYLARVAMRPGWTQLPARGRGPDSIFEQAMKEAE
jgi:hypothetical protein